jgi:putative transposase
MLVMGFLMARIPERWDGFGHWYFVTVVTLRRQPVFAEERACKVLQSAFHEVHHYHPFRLAALVILPDHWHALIRPGVRSTNEAGTQPAGTHPRPTKVVIERIVGAVKKNVLRDLQMKRSTIWQARFLDHRIRDEDDFLHHLEYIRFNPIKHGYVTEPDQYEWRFIHNRPFGG